MPDVTASRTLVKSAPELWTECSDADALGRHLDGFGDIRITRLEPESAVAWEGELASGTVRLEPSGWGTRVVLTATPAVESGTVVESEPAVEPEAVESEAVVEPEAAAVEPEAVVEPEPEVDLAAAEIVAARPGFFSRLFGRWRREPVPEAAAEPKPEQEPESEVDVEPLPAAEAASEVGPSPAFAAVPDPEAALNAALDSLGQAHHRPYSRA